MAHPLPAGLSECVESPVCVVTAISLLLPHARLRLRVRVVFVKAAVIFALHTLGLLLPHVRVRLGPDVSHRRGLPLGDLTLLARRHPPVRARRGVVVGLLLLERRLVVSLLLVVLPHGHRCIILSRPLPHVRGRGSSLILSRPLPSSGALVLLSLRPLGRIPPHGHPSSDLSSHLFACVATSVALRRLSSLGRLGRLGGLGRLGVCR
eukprot:scaffold5047_cov42-Phaeocystis_antarctica.AAC.1